VVEACRRAIVARGKNSLILHEKGTPLVLRLIPTRGSCAVFFFGLNMDK
jgi:hypothetical protein